MPGVLLSSASVPCFAAPASEERGCSEPPKARTTTATRAEHVFTMHTFGVSPGVDDYTHQQRRRYLGPQHSEATSGEACKTAAKFSNIDGMAKRLHFHGAAPPGSLSSPHLVASALDLYDIDAHFGRGRQAASVETGAPWESPSWDDAIGSTDKATRRRFFEQKYHSDRYAELIDRPRIRCKSEEPKDSRRALEWRRLLELEQGWQLTGSWQRSVPAKAGVPCPRGERSLRMLLDVPNSDAESFCSDSVSSVASHICSPDKIVVSYAFAEPGQAPQGLPSLLGQMPSQKEKNMHYTRLASPAHNSTTPETMTPRTDSPPGSARTEESLSKIAEGAEEDSKENIGSTEQPCSGNLSLAARRVLRSVAPDDVVALANSPAKLAQRIQCLLDTPSLKAPGARSANAIDCQMVRQKQFNPRGSLGARKLTAEAARKDALCRGWKPF